MDSQPFSSVDNYHKLDGLLKTLGGGGGSILHLCSGKFFGGVERMLLSIAKNQRDLGSFNHQFAYSYEGIFSNRLGNYSGLGCCIGQFQFRNPFSYFKSYGNLLRAINRNKPSVLVCHDSWTQASFGYVANRCKVKLARMFHGILSKKSNAFDLLSSRIKPDLYIVNSESTGNSFALAIPNTPYEICYPPCLFGDPQRREEYRLKVREGFSVNNTTKVIFSAGRFEEFKGLDVLIRALANFPDGHAWECWIAGQAQNKIQARFQEKLKNLSSSLGISSKVRWLGHVDDVEHFYAAADVYCQPNKTPESFGMTFLESQAMGCPVVTTAIGGALETVRSDGKNVFLNQANEMQVFQALEKVLKLGMNIR